MRFEKSSASKNVYGRKKDFNIIIMVFLSNITSPCRYKYIRFEAIRNKVNLYEKKTEKVPRISITLHLIINLNALYNSWKMAEILFPSLSSSLILFSRLISSSVVPGAIFQ